MQVLLPACVRPAQVAAALFVTSWVSASAHHLALQGSVCWGGKPVGVLVGSAMIFWVIVRFPGARGPPTGVVIHTTTGRAHFLHMCVRRLCLLPCMLVWAQACADLVLSLRCLASYLAAWAADCV